jgi:hypothetical protein
VVVSVARCVMKNNEHKFVRTRFFMFLCIHAVKFLTFSLSILWILIDLRPINQSCILPPFTHWRRHVSACHPRVVHVP